MDAASSGHPTRKKLSSFGLGKLDEPSADVVSRHLEQCPDCRKQVAEMSADSFLGRVRDAQVQAPVMSATDQSRTSSATSSRFGPQPAVPPPSHTLPPGLADHADYEIKRELGRGGMGVVYLAHNRLMGRDEVLKVMGRNIMERPGVLDRFVREIRAVAKLRHANIVTAYHAFRLGDSFVFAMEHVEGLDLSRMVKAKGPLSVGHACNFIYQAALGLQHACEEGLVHRDIKPGNLMLARKGDKATIKILDFGLAKASREERVDGALTHEGQALGTPDFIAPEQIVNAPNVDIRADIYSLGGTLYYLLIGQPPFQANSLYDLYQAHISRDVDPLNLIRPEVPVELAALVAKMMAKEPERRFQTPGEVAHALTPFFKKRDGALKRAGPEISSASRGGTGRLAAAVELNPTRPATDEPTAAVRGNGAADQDARPTQWNTLIDVRETQDTHNGSRVSPVAIRPPWIWAALAAAVLLVGLLAVWGVTVRISTSDGTIVLEDLPDQASVLIAGERATIRWPGGRGSAEITVVPGSHWVEVKKDGFTTQGQTVIVRKGKRVLLKVHLEGANKPGTVAGDAVRGAPSAIPDNPSTPHEGRPQESSDRARTAQTGGATPPAEGPADDWEKPPGAHDRRAAETVLRRGGTVIIRLGEVDAEINASNGLPAAPFKLVGAKVNNKADLVDTDLETFRGLTDISEVSVPNCKFITDAGIARLQGLINLRRLDLWATQLTDAGVVSLGRLEKLEWLSLGETRVTGNGLAGIRGLTNLRQLTLWWNRITDDDLVHLEGLLRLESLTLAGTPVTDRGVAHLKGLPQLRHLNLYTTQAAGEWMANPQGLAQLKSLSLRRVPGVDANLVHLRNLPQLESLTLGLTVTDAGLVHLRGLTQLKSLKLDGNRVTDAGIKQLRGLTQLKELDLRETAVTPQGIEDLKKALPTCRIISDPAKRPPENAAALVRESTFNALANRKTWDRQLVVNAQPSKRNIEQWRLAPGLTVTPENGLVYVSEVFGRAGVIFTHPFDTKTPATIDFSKITRANAGQLSLMIKSYQSPGKGGRIVVNGGQATPSAAEIGAADRWKTIPIVFDHEAVIVEHHALGWNCEGMFFDYQIEKKPTEAARAVAENARTTDRRFLFNGKDLEGWKNRFAGNGSEWSVVRNALVARPSGVAGHPSVLVTEQNFANFRLRFKFLVETPEGGGCIEVRRSAIGDRMSGYHVQLGTWPTARAQISVGSVSKLSNYQYGRPIPADMPAKQTDVAANTWHTMEIAAVGNEIRVSLKERFVAQLVDPGEPCASGEIGLCGRADSFVRYKEISIEVLPDDAARRKSSKIKN
jgi:serine/threonine protein kinase